LKNVRRIITNHLTVVSYLSYLYRLTSSASVLHCSGVWQQCLTWLSYNLQLLTTSWFFLNKRGVTLNSRTF